MVTVSNGRGTPDDLKIKPCSMKSLHQKPTFLAEFVGYMKDITFQGLECIMWVGVDAYVFVGLTIT